MRAPTTAAATAPVSPAALLPVLALAVAAAVPTPAGERPPDAVGPRIDHHGNRLDPDGEFVYTNALAASDSPYLRQHAHNPVDWHEWGGAAFALARSTSRPIFLSIGYSTCHWCHVMARESFSDPEVAELLNSGFVPIKVDREARPDVDAVYMAAAHAMGERGGWPLSVWLTPELEPFAAGTYFPKRRFVTMLLELQARWIGDPAAVRSRAREVAGRARARLATTRAVDRLDDGLFDRAVSRLVRGFDRRLGGWGVPRFPNEAPLLYLLSRYQRDGDHDALAVARRALDAMQAGGIHDQIGGGFARYATDATWTVPHFEKMLYNQAWLGRAYLEAWRLTGDADDRRAAAGILRYVARDLRAPGGAFYSAEDADSAGEEGRFYLWRREEVIAILGKADGELLADFHDIAPPGNFREAPGASIPTAHHDAAAFARAHGLPEKALRERLAGLRAKLTEVRAKRIRPERDEKVMVDWNGYMIGTYALAARVLDQPAHAATAAGAADFLLTKLRDDDGHLLHQWYAGAASVPAFLDDYMALAEGLLELHATTGEARWRATARKLYDTARSQFRDPADGAFRRSGPRQPKLLARDKDAYDGARPSGNSLAALVAVRLWRLTGEDRYREDTERVILAFGTSLQSPRGSAFLLRAAEELRKGPVGPRIRGGDGIVAASTDGRLHRIAAGNKTGAEVTVTLDVAPGWHVNAAAPVAEDLIPTELAAAGGDGFTLTGVRYPRALVRKLGFTETPLRLYTGRAPITAHLAVPAGTAPGPAIAHLDLRVQPCDDRLCKKPRTLRLAVPLLVGAPR